MAASTLSEIRVLVRQLCNAVSPAQLSDSTIDFACNTFIAYDFPYHVHLKKLKTTVTWYTQAFVETYFCDALLPTTHPLYDFENRYSLVEEPIYISGVQCFFTQDRTQFFNRFSQNEYIENFTLGNGVATNYTGFFGSGSATSLYGAASTRATIAQNSVIFTAVVNGHTDPVNPALDTYDTVTIIDIPTRNIVPAAQGYASNATTGTLVNAATQVACGTVNYITGQYSVTFPLPPVNGTQVTRQSYPYAAAQPTAVLFHELSRIENDVVVNNKAFTLRPIPDRSYAINMEVYRNPVELLAAGNSPELNQWWQYIAYGAAKKIMERRSDADGVQRIMQEFKEQELLVLRRTIIQQASQRSDTIYAQGSGFGVGWGGFNWPTNW